MMSFSLAQLARSFAFGLDICALLTSTSPRPITTFSRTVLAARWNKEQNSVMIEMHEVLMTEYVYILYSYTLYAKKKDQ